MRKMIARIEQIARSSRRRNKNFAAPAYTSLVARARGRKRLHGGFGALLLLPLSALCGWLAAQAAGLVPQALTFSGASNRILTPNGDGKNDNVAFQFDNPQFSDVKVKIYDLKGGLVAELGPTTGGMLVWDGKSNGRTVGGGGYIYIVEGEGRLFRGAVLVVR